MTVSIQKSNKIMKEFDVLEKIKKIRKQKLKKTK